MELGKLAIRAKQMGWIQLSMARYLQNIHIILLHAVVLLEAHYFDNLQPAILLHAVEVDYVQLKINFHLIIILQQLTCICGAQRIEARPSLRHC